jgi:hypothetical protein
MMAERAPFFIVGSGRSGTTLLRLLLSGHTRVHIPPETWFIISLVKQLPLDEHLSAYQVQQAVQIITSHYRWPDLGIEASDLQRWAAELNAPRLRNVIDLVYDSILQNSGKSRLGDKTPPYIAIVPQLAALYPEARFIHLIRDGRDVAISYIELGYECRFYDGLRFEWIASMEKARSYRMSEYADRILEIRYEELVAQPESSLRTICGFLGECFETQMLNQPLRTDAVPTREAHIHTKLDRPLSSDATGNWRKKLSAIECFWMEACMHEYLAELGYEIRFSSRAWDPLLTATGTMFRSAAPLLDRAIPFLKRRNIISKNIHL